MAEIPRISLPTPSTQQAQDDSAAHARADLQKVRQRHANVGAILQGLGGLANVAQERFNAIANADALIATDKAHTDLVQFSSIMELDLSKSDQPDQAMATYWDEYERTVLALVETLPTAGAQRAFRANANAIKRQRIPYVLDLAEGRSQELVIDQFSGRLYELEQAGNVESISGLFQEFADYLKPGWQGPGGIMDKALARAQTNRFRERGRQIYEEQGPGAASAWLLDNRNMSNLHPSELRGLLMLVDAWTEVDDMTRAEQEQKEMFGLHEAMEQLNAVGIFASPDMIGRLVDEHITSASPDRAAVLKARLIDTTGANDREKSIFSWHLNNRSKNLNAQQVPSFQRFVAAAQVSGRITRTEANRLMDAATGVQTKHKAVGVEHLEGLFEQLQMRNHALENDLDPAEAIVGNALYRDGRQITLGALDGAYIDILNPDGTAGRVYLANELSKLLDEYSDRYEKTLKDTKQVPQDPNQIAVMLWDQWLRQIMPGVQRGDVMGQESGAALYQGGQVTFPGSEEFTFADAWEKAKKRNRRDFDDARAIQMGLDDMHDYVPADIGVTSQPAFREITGQMALQMSGVMDRVDVDLIEWDALMRAGLFQEAGMVAARKLPVDEDALQTLRLNGAITAFRMVPGGARVQLHPLMPWVDVPLMPPTVRLAFTGDDEEVSYAPPTSNGAAAAAQSWQEFLPVPGDAGVGFDAGAGPPPGIDVPADEADAFRWANNQAVRAAMLAPRPGEPGAGIVLMDDQPPTSTAKPVRPGHPGMGAERPGQPGVSPRVASDGLPPTSTAEADRPAHPEMGAELPGQPGVAPRVASDRLPPGATTEAGQPAHPGMGAGSLGEPGVPERIASDRLPPGDETEPGRPAHPGMEAEQQGQPGVPERVASDRLPPEDETEPSRPLRDRIATTVVDVEAEELPDLTLPEGKWPADSELPIYEGVYDVHDLVDTSIETLRLWNAGGRGMAVEEAAGYLENISRNARDMLSSEAQSRLDATLGEYYGRKRMQPEDHRMTGSGSDLAPSQRDIPTSIDLPELGGPGAGAPIGSGYSGLNRDDDAGSKSRPRQEGLGPPPMMPGAAGGMSVLPDTPWGPASQPSRPTTQGRGIQRPGEPGAGIVLMDDQPPGPTAEPGRPAHPVMSAGRLGQPGVPPPAAGAAPASTAAAGRPAHPGMGAGRPGELTEAGQPVTTMGVTDMPTPPPNPALAWEVPPEFHLIGVDTGGVQLYVSVQPGEPPPPPMTAGRPGELAVAVRSGSRRRTPPSRLVRRIRRWARSGLANLACPRV